MRKRLNPAKAMMVVLDFLGNPIVQAVIKFLSG